ncbi:unnamed protein product, partial [Allacma fusca]
MARRRYFNIKELHSMKTHR